MPLLRPRTLFAVTCFVLVGVQSQQLRDAIIIDTSDAQNAMQAKRVLLGFLGECANSPSPSPSPSSSPSASDSSFSNTDGSANNSLLLDLYKRLTKLEQQNLDLNKALSQLSSNANNCTSSASGQSSSPRSSPNPNNDDTLTTTATLPVNLTMSERVAHKDWIDCRSPADRYEDYRHIANMQPVLWLSAHYFDGFKRTSASVRTGLVHRRSDVVGNRVVKEGIVQVIDDYGYSAYAFGNSTSITATTAVNNQFTLVTVFRYPSVPPHPEGRFFSSSSGNRLFAGHAGSGQRWHIDSWIHVSERKTADIEILMGTNNFGIKNLWTYDQPLVQNSNAGANAWGTTIIGCPAIYSDQAPRVNVYEALVFDKVLSADERIYTFAVLRKWYDL